MPEQRLLLGRNLVRPEASRSQQASMLLDRSLFSGLYEEFMHAWQALSKDGPTAGEYPEVHSRGDCSDLFLQVSRPGSKVLVACDSLEPSCQSLLARAKAPTEENAPRGHSASTMDTIPTTRL